MAQVPKARIGEAVAEAVSSEAALSPPKLKKGEVVLRAEEIGSDVSLLTGHYRKEDHEARVQSSEVHRFFHRPPSCATRPIGAITAVVVTFAPVQTVATSFISSAAVQIAKAQAAS